MNKTGWQNASLSNNQNPSVKQKIFLSKGNHTITFSTSVPYVPSIEFIRISRRIENSIIQDSYYNSYIDSLNSISLPANYATIKNDSANAIKITRVLPNPEGDYLHEIDITFTYTYYQFFYFYAGTPVTFETKKSNPCASDPVMHLFNYEDPINKGSWGNDDGGECYQAKIVCTIPYTGYYCLLVRSFWPYTSQTSDLYLYDNLYASNIPIAGTGFRCDHTLTEEINYFTCFLTGDSRLWIESYEPALEGRILGFNDDYYGGGDFNWGLNARVKKSYPQRMWNCFVSTYSSYYPTGTCDLYMRCKNSNIYYPNMPYFPNLKADDAIMSAPASGIYNCISWSGGITSYWEWPLSSGSRYYVQGNPLASFDNYYGNNPVRYSGSEGWTYTRTGATSSNNQIDLWSLNGIYTHGSVNARWDNITIRTPANEHPHGYDWESKPGMLMRTFHPRYALSGSSYGNVDKYYKWINIPLLKSNLKFITSEESIRLGLSILDNVEFSEFELSRISLLSEELNIDELKEFDYKYETWRSTWNNDQVKIHSDPQKYAKSEEYFQFFNYCIVKDKKVLPLLLEKLNQGDLFVIVPLEDLTYTGNEKLMEEVHKENRENQYTKDGVFIIHTLLGNWLKYGKKLLDNFEEYKGFFPRIGDQGLGQNMTIPKNEVVIQNYPNPFNPSTQIRYGIPSDSKISVKIYDIIGKEIAVLVDNEFKTAGWHNANWNGEDMNGNSVSSGIYFCRILYKSQVQTIKLMLAR